MMLIIPFMIPLLVIGFSYLFNGEVNTPIEEYNKIGFAYDATEEEKNIIANVGIDAIYGNVSELEEKYEKGEIDLLVTKVGSLYLINEEEPSNASSLVEAYIESYKDYIIKSNLADIELPVLNYKTQEGATASENFFANYISTYAFMFIIMAITISSTYPATDTTAGEKERGTLETLLTFPIKSRDIIIGKFLSVATSCIITGLLSLLLAQISLGISGSTFEIYKDIDILMNTKTLILSILIIIAYSILISGLSIAIASKCKTFKEAQSALTPLTFISFFPAMIAYLLNIQNSLTLSLIPFLNFTLIFNDMQTGNLEIANVIAMFASTIIFIVLILTLIIKQYKSEKVLF